MFVSRTSESSVPRPRVLLALDRGDLEWLRENAERLAPIRLTDALRICLTVRDRDPERLSKPLRAGSGGSRLRRAMRRSPTSSSPRRSRRSTR